MAKGRVKSADAWVERRRVGEANDHWPDCPYCEAPFFYTEGELDHLESHRSGGSNKLNNLVLVCKECNRRKHDTPLHIGLYVNHISLESVYARLKAQDKLIPQGMLDTLGYDD